jgi:hypothetical protein
MLELKKKQYNKRINYHLKNGMTELFFKDKIHFIPPIENHFIPPIV